jgi:hypothetical protein
MRPKRSISAYNCAILFGNLIPRWEKFKGADNKKN